MRRLLRPLGALALVAAIVWANRSLDLSWTGVVEGARAWIEPFGAWGPVAFVAICAFGAVAHAPEIVVIALGGVLFGKVGGFVYGMVGAVMGASMCFLLARYLFRDAVRRSLIERFGTLKRLDDQLERRGFLTVASLRLLLFLTPPMNWAVGTTRVRFVDYLGGSVVGLVPGVAITVSFADALTQASSLSDLMTPGLMIPAVLLGGFLVVSTFVLHRYLAREREG